VLIAILAGVWAISAGDYFFMGMYAATMGVTAWGVMNPLGRRTPEGREAYAKVQGLEMYIRTAETNRLAKLNAPEDTVEKFEELLPYALALGCASAWQKRFDKVLLAVDYDPQWVVATDRTGRHRYRKAFATVTGFGGMAAAANAARAAHAHYKLTSSFSGPGSGSGSGGSRGGSGFGGGGSVGGGSGGTRVGGW